MAENAIIASISTHLHMTEERNEISDLCVSCGMCCDGTLFTKAFVRDEADRKIADDLGLVTGKASDKLYFQLPCSHFSSCCTVYSLKRPHTCSAFFCAPIKRFRGESQTFIETTQQIESLLEQRSKLMKIASEFPELRDLDITELRSKLAEAAEDSSKVKTYRMLFLILFIFDDLKTKYFTPAKADTLIF